MEEKLQWVFGLYDLDGDGLISKEEMLDVVGSIYEMLGRYTQPQILEPHVAAREHVDRIFHVNINISVHDGKKISELKVIENKISKCQTRIIIYTKFFSNFQNFLNYRNLLFILKINLNFLLNI